MGKQRKRLNSKIYYSEYGNTVRKYEVKEDYNTREKRQRLRVVNKSAYKKVGKKKKVVSFKSMLVFCSIVAMIFVCGSNLKAKADMNRSVKKLSKYQASLDKMISENDATQNSINTHVDLNEIYNEAINRLGMVSAGSNRTILYDKTNNEYVRQNNELQK